MFHLVTDDEGTGRAGREGQLMDMNVYLVEVLIRDRLAKARKSAEIAALLGELNQGSLRTHGIGRRLLELGRSLVTRRDERRPALDGR